MTDDALPQVQLVAPDGVAIDAFEVVTLVEHSLRVRSVWMLELDEEVTLRVQRGGAISNVRARVARHVRSGADVVTTLDLLDEQPLRAVIMG